jgi:tRNA1Val (adenine37-N6)-methyltransferase
MEPEKLVTTDTFFNGKITVRQARSGYRHSIDAVILANQVRPRPGDRILDLGTGCGIIPLIVAYRHPDVRLFGVEIQSDLAEMARSNAGTNGLAERIEIIGMDMQHLQPATLSGPVDIVVSNPPYYRVSSGRINPDSQRAVARHELKVDLAGVLSTAARMLRTAGKFLCIYGGERLVDLFSQMRRSNIEPKTVRTIHSRAAGDARLVLVEGVKAGSPGMTIGKPLIIFRDGGGYTEELSRMFNPPA